MNTTTASPHFVPGRRAARRAQHAAPAATAGARHPARATAGQRIAALRLRAGAAWRHPPAQLERLRRGAALGRHRLRRGYIAGDWTTPDLADLLQVLLVNRQHVQDVVYGHWAGRLLYRLRHLLRRNSKAGSQKNIHAHYDLGNAFYELWLDPTMNYSSAWFDGDLGKPMREAQRAKVRRALVQAGVPTRRACWRSAAAGARWRKWRPPSSAPRHRHHPVDRAAGVRAGPDGARRRPGPDGPAAAGLPRRPDGPYDAVCSIEMVEAVGREYWPGYFAAVRACSSRAAKPASRAS
jgi:cyclopropane-fatty-acyl-phospholipid synthase